MTPTQIRARMTATLSQIAWYIERDGMNQVSYLDRGTRGVARTYTDGRFSVTVEPEDIPQLDALRDKVAARLHAKEYL